MQLLWYFSVVMDSLYIDPGYSLTFQVYTRMLNLPPNNIQAGIPSLTPPSGLMMFELNVEMMLL